jgi:hypothetical protein
MRLLTLFVLPAVLLAGQSRFARLGEFQGQVEVQLTPADLWMTAERNLPVTESAVLRTGTGSRVEIEMDDGSVWRLGPDSVGAISDYTRLSTGQRITLLTLDRGTAYYTGQPVGKDVAMLVTPGAQVTVLQGSRVRQTAQPGWSQTAVLSGQVRFTSPAAEIDVNQGTAALVDLAKAGRFFLHSEIAPEPLDRWNDDRDRARSAPASAAYVNAASGLADLDAAGEWIATEDLGMVWRPQVAKGWVPYQNGRWHFYDAVGYAWISREAWGWLPYHNGRWARTEKLGWVWQPSANPVFHPAEVYWLRGADFVGWGPLTPGEQWNAPNPGAITPQGYLAGVTSYAQLAPDARALNGTGFPPPTAEQMKTAFFIPALPSPAILLTRLDAVRPPVDAGNTLVTPSVPGYNFGDPVPTLRPITIRTEVPVPIETTVAVPVPVPVIEENVIVNPPAAATTKTVNVPAVPKPAAAAAVSKPPASAPPRNPRREQPQPTGPAEQEFHRQVLQDIDPAAPNFPKALEDLNAWTAKYPTSASANDRLYYYIHVYNGMARADQVLETAAPVVQAGVRQSYSDPQQVLQILVAAATSLTKVRTPNARQIATGQKAAHELLDFLPDYFAPRRKPANISAPAWQIARTQLEDVARLALAKKAVGRTAAN